MSHARVASAPVRREIAALWRKLVSLLPDIAYRGSGDKLGSALLSGFTAVVLGLIG
jgi:hypothetical protein